MTTDTDTVNGMGEVVGIHSIAKSYGERAALRPLTTALHPGVTAVIGRNGAGKSTLIEILASTLRPDSGRLSVAGDVVDGKASMRAYRRRLGWVPQSAAVPHSRTLRQYLAYVAWLKEVPRPSRASAVEQAAAVVGLVDRLDSRVSTLSGGMLRRATLAQALVNDPRVLLLDEPTVGLDPAQRDRFCALVAGLADPVVVFATHLMEDVVGTASRLIVLDKGSVVFDGPVTQFCGVPDGDVTVELLGRRFRDAVAEVD
jgi:ABC-2 type transport system ATP-binding protein